MEDEPWVALEGKFITNVVDPSLWYQISFMIKDVHKDYGAGTSSVGLVCRRKMKRRYQAKLVTHPIINWILPCIADPLKQRRFPSICPTDNEDAKVGIFGSEFRNFFRGHCYSWIRIDWRRKINWQHGIDWRHSDSWKRNRRRRVDGWRQRNSRRRSNKGWMRIRAALGRALSLQFKSKYLLQSIGKFWQSGCVHQPYRLTMRVGDNNKEGYIIMPSTKKVVFLFLSIPRYRNRA